MKLGKAFASIGRHLRKFDNAVADVETLIEQKLQEKKTGLNHLLSPHPRGRARPARPTGENEHPDYLD